MSRTNTCHCVVPCMPRAPATRWFYSCQEQKHATRLPYSSQEHTHFTWSSKSCQQHTHTSLGGPIHVKSTHISGWSYSCQERTHHWVVLFVARAYTCYWEVIMSRAHKSLGGLIHGKSKHILLNGYVFAKSTHMSVTGQFYSCQGNSHGTMSSIAYVYVTRCDKNSSLLQTNEQNDSIVLKLALKLHGGQNYIVSMISCC